MFKFSLFLTQSIQSNEHTVNGRPRQNNRPSFFYVYTFEDESDYNIDILEEPKLNHILKPNLVGHELEFSSDKSLSIILIWTWT